MLRSIVGTFQRLSAVAGISDAQFSQQQGAEDLLGLAKSGVTTNAAEKSVQARMFTASTTVEALQAASVEPDKRKSFETPQSFGLF
jgi:hypothetical protein